MTDDLLVVGGGLGGCLAACTAAQEAPDAQIRLLSPVEDRFDYHSGLIDVLGYTPESASNSASSPPSPVDNPLAALADLPDDHPYSLLGPETVRDALARFDEVCPTYRGGHTEQNALVMTPGGRPTPAARYPAGMAPGLLSTTAATLLVGFDQLPDFDAHLVAAGLDGSLPYNVTSLPVEFPTSVTEYPAGPHLAAALDENAPVDETTGETTGDETRVRETLADLIRPELDLEPRVGFPAVLGDTAHDEIRRELQTTLSAEVFEIPVGPPSIPGRRLQSALLESLSEAGVTVERRCEIAGFDASEGRIERVHTDEGPYEAREFVLATGDLETGGLVADRAGVRETVFDCHVSHPEDSSEWVAREFLGDHPFVRFGVDTDETFRPLDARGNVEYENLRAVGQLLGGPDYVAEQSSDGVAIATGYAVGKRVGKDR